MKRAVHGANHNTTEAHLQRFFAEWDFKWNMRTMTDGERVASALKGAEGRGLAYPQNSESRERSSRKRRASRAGANTQKVQCDDRV
jgi:hypothetical protein